MKRIGISVNATSWDETFFIIMRCIIPSTNCFANSRSCSSQVFFNPFHTTIFLQKKKKKSYILSKISKLTSIYNQSQNLIWRTLIWLEILVLDLFIGLVERGPCREVCATAGAGAGAGETCVVVCFVCMWSKEVMEEKMCER